MLFDNSTLNTTMTFQKLKFFFLKSGNGFSSRGTLPPELFPLGLKSIILKV